MISPGAVIASVLPVYLLMVAGALLRRVGVVRPEHDAGVMRVVYTVMMPCFILDRILGSSVLRSGSSVMWLIAIGFGSLVGGTLLGLAVGRLIGLERGTGIRTFALTAGCQNFGFTAVPVAQILWGAASLAPTFVHNIGIEAALWSVGVMMMGGEHGFSWRRLINGPIIAVFVGLIITALGWSDHATGAWRTAMSMIGVGAFPLAIFITGCAIMDLVTDERPSWKVALGAAVVRLALAPAMILTAAKLLPLATELKQVLVVQAAMPAGLTSILIAKMYGGRPAIAVQVVIATTVLSLLTLPWIITWGSRWMDLKPLLP